MAQVTGGQRELVLDEGKVAVWANKDGVFLGSTDPDAEFIVALRDTPAQIVRAALAQYGRKTD